jgi:hypothetical protein
VRIYKTYGADAVRLVSENPYRLARDIRADASASSSRGRTLGTAWPASTRVLRRGAAPTISIRFAVDSPLEEGGFELSVPGGKQVPARNAVDRRSSALRAETAPMFVDNRAVLADHDTIA